MKTDNQVLEYLTLSYCWGGEEKHGGRGKERDSENFDGKAKISGTKDGESEEYDKEEGKEDKRGK